MRKLLVLAALVLLSALSVRAQSVVTPGNPILNSAGVPVGTCSSFNIDVITSTGALYTCAAGSWTLVGGAGAVSSVFGRTGAVVATSGDYTLDQIGNPAANTNFSFGAFNLGLTAPGVFTLTAQNDQFLSTLTGGGTCTPLTILNLGGSTIKLTDNIATCTNLPTSSVTNGFTNGFAAYMINPNANSAGQFGWTGSVGYYSQVWCRGGSAANTRCWGANFGVSDDTALPATLFGNEYDVTVNNNTTTGAGTIYSFRGAGQPTANNFPAISVNAPAGAGTFTAGYSCASGAISSTNNFDCVTVGQVASGLSQNSQGIHLYAADASAGFNAGISVNAGHYMFFGGMPVINYGSNNGSAGFGGGWGITLKATVTFTQNQLVKIDTANADSVVLCTTADTICSGFAVGANNCGSSNTLCSIVDVPGSLVKGILGTGTCAIGNWVIVDTTTNGDVKCATVQPVAWQGFALAANSTVGTAFDVLVSPGTTATTAYLTSLYTNATTTFSSVTGLSFPVAANTNYKVTCDLDYQVSASTLDVKIQWTGPSTPTFLVYDLDTAVTGSTLSASVNPATATTTGAFSTALSEAGTPTATTNFPLRTTMTLINGANAGTIQLQAAATAAGTVSILPGSCSIQR